MYDVIKVDQYLSGEGNIETSETFEDVLALYMTKLYGYDRMTMV